MHSGTCRAEAPFGCIGLCTLNLKNSSAWSMSLSSSLCPGRVHFLNKHDAKRHSKLFCFGSCAPVAHRLKKGQTVSGSKLSFSQPMKDGDTGCTRAVLLAYISKDGGCFPVLLLFRPHKATLGPVSATSPKRKKHPSWVRRKQQKKKPFSGKTATVQWERYSIVAFAFQKKMRERMRLWVETSRIDGSTSREEMELRPWSVPLRRGGCLHRSPVETLGEWQSREHEHKRCDIELRGTGAEQCFLETLTADENGKVKTRLADPDDQTYTHEVRFTPSGPTVQKVCLCTQDFPEGFPLTRQNENLECCGHAASLHGGPDFNALFASASVLNGSRFCSIALSFGAKNKTRTRSTKRDEEVSKQKRQTRKKRKGNWVTARETPKKGKKCYSDANFFLFSNKKPHF